MNLTSIFYQASDLSQTEQDQIIEILSHPTVKKYLQLLGRNDLAELATLSTQNLSDSEVSRKHSLVQGKLSTLVTLLNIQKQE